MDLATALASATKVLSSGDVGDAVIETVNYLMDAILKMKHSPMREVMDQINASFRNINLTIDGITREDEKLAREAIEESRNSTLEHHVMDMELKELASETILRMDQFLRLLGKIDDQNKKKTLVYIGSKLVSLVDRSHKQLTEASSKYLAIAKKLTKILTKIETFEDRVKKIHEENNVRKEEAQKKLNYENSRSWLGKLFHGGDREDARATSSEWNAVVNKSNTVINSTGSLKNLLDENQKDTMQAVTDLGDWKTHVEKMFEDFKSQEDFEADFEFSPEEIKISFEGLKAVCSTYIEQSSQRGKKLKENVKGLAK